MNKFVFIEQGGRLQRGSRLLGPCWQVSLLISCPHLLCLPSAQKARPFNYGTVPKVPLRFVVISDLYTLCHCFAFRFRLVCRRNQICHARFIAVLQERWLRSRSCKQQCVYAAKYLDSRGYLPGKDFLRVMAFPPCQSPYSNSVHSTWNFYTGGDPTQFVIEVIPEQSLVLILMSTHF